MSEAPGGRSDILRRALLELKDARARLADAERARSEPVAVVGMGCRFPGGVDSVEALWDLLLEERDAVTEVPAERWNVDDYYDPDADAPGRTYTRHGAFIADVDAFDAGLFGIPPREAALMDPQHRLVLEMAWTALEHAVIAPDSMRDTAAAVFLGMTAGEYAHLAIKTGGPARLDAYVTTGNAANFASGRLSYLLGLRGPSITLDTACSSSLVCIHLACQCLRAGECDIALAGGVSLQLLPETTVALAKGRMLSPSGRCRTFDARADGYVRGEGCGIVVLKRLSDAVAGGDRIWAVIRGSAVNQDGRSSAVTVPNAAAQEDVIRTALAMAGMGPADVGYVETHGTGTPLGDPIELQALAHALSGDRRNALLVGSVKTNIGHLEAAAGVAGFMKAVLAVDRGLIPAHLHVEEPTPLVDWDRLRLAVPVTATGWPEGPRVAGVSSFGISGTNAHVIVTAPPEPATRPSEQACEGFPEVVKLAARGDAGLAAAARALAAFVREVPQAPLSEIAYLADVGRADLPDRAAVVATTHRELADGLQAIAEGRGTPHTARGRMPAERPRIAFLVPGQGSRLAGAAQDLYAREPACRSALDELAEVLGPLTELPLSALLEPGPGSERALLGTDVAQQALYALAIALGAWWQRAGLRPHALLGHSVGAYAAASLAGVLSPLDGARLVRERSRLMARLLPPGAMAAVTATPEQLHDHLSRHAELAVAARNTPTETVVSGPAGAVAGLLGELAAEGIGARILPVGHAFHSALVEPVLDALAAELAHAPLQPASVPLVSDLTGRLAGPEVARPEYWIRHARNTVRFTQALQTVRELGCELLIELGPSGTLLSLAGRTLPPGAWTGLPSLRPGRSGPEQLRRSLASAYCTGAHVAWRAVTRPATRPWPLPAYPFQRRRHWIPAAAVPPPAPRPPAAGPTLSRIAVPPPHELFTSELDVEGTPVLGEHEVHGIPVVPGVVYLQLMLAAAEQAGQPDPVVTRLALLSPLLLDRRTARTAYLQFDTPTESGTRAVRVYTHAADRSPAWTLHAVAEVTSFALQGEPAPQIALEEIAARCPQEVTGAQFYERLWHPDFRLGRCFRLIERVFRGEREALAVLREPVATAGSAPVHRQLLMLDACVQALTAALPEAGPGGGQHRPVLLGTGHERFVAHRLVTPARLWCWAVLRSGGSASPTELTGDLRVLDEHGVAVAEVVGVQFRPVSVQTLRRLADIGLPATGGEGGRGPAAERLRLRHQLASAASGDGVRLLTQYLAGQVGEVLGMPAVEIELGKPIMTELDSLMLAELATRIEAVFDVEVPVSTLFEHSSLHGLAGWLFGRMGGARHRPPPDRQTPSRSPTMSVAELSREAALDDSIAPRIPADPSRIENPAAVLLTGATGFVGAFLLDELLARTSASVYCLVRGRESDEALRRVSANLRARGLDPARAEGRIVPVPGDLSRPLLGLPPSDFAALADQLDAVFHCGAAVTWTYPYTALKDVNVGGTREILRLATTGRALPVHFISTIGVFSSATRQPDPVPECEPLENAGALSVGYAQSKWVAERLVRAAAARGLPVSIFRPATGGHSRTGAFNAADHVCLVLKGCIELGCVPVSDMPLQIAPVDFVARAAVHLALRPELSGRTFHLVNPHSISWAELFDMVAELGWPLRRRPLPEWRAELVLRSRSGSLNALAGLLPFLADTLDQARLPAFQCAATFDALAGSGITCPPLDAELLRTYFTRFMETGFVESPHRSVHS